MNRSGNADTITDLIKKIRQTIPNITLRTTFITGFPGESEKEFEELHGFIKQTEFNRLGCFAYSAEENTPAANFENQIDEQTKQDRADIIMNDQMLISSKLNCQKIGTTQEVLIEGYDDYIRCYFGRTGADAPEIDGKVFFTTTKPLVIGDFVNVKINDSIEYDLLGEAILWKI